jgi:hypothetical protein
MKILDLFWKLLLKIIKNFSYKNINLILEIIIEDNLEFLLKIIQIFLVKILDLFWKLLLKILDSFWKLLLKIIKNFSYKNINLILEIIVKNN